MVSVASNALYLVNLIDTSLIKEGPWPDFFLVILSSVKMGVVFPLCKSKYANEDPLL